MRCARCKAVIADKAIVCYRCGAPTAVPAAPERRPPAGRSPWSLAAVSLGLAAASAWGAWNLESGSPGQMAAMALAAVWLVAAGFFLVRRRRG